MSPLYVQDDWRYKIAPSPRWKRQLYRLALPILSLAARRHLRQAYRQFRPERIIGKRGLPIEARRRWVDRQHRIEGATLLVQGTGTGWDLVSWARYRPSVIYAVDLFAFDEWSQVRKYIWSEFQVKVHFIQCSLAELPLTSGTVDIACSDAVFEHCQDIGAVLRESRRVLRSSGRLYAAYGPLWYSAGGDHFSGRGGLQTVYNHIRLNEADYIAYFMAQRQAVENFRSGGRYVELGLFSRLTTSEYLDQYDKAGFAVERLILEVSTEGLLFRRRWANLYDQLVEQGHAPDDLLTKANLVILKPVTAKGKVGKRTPGAAAAL